MRVRQLMTQDVRSVRPEADVNEAAQIMWENDCGCVPVVDEHLNVVGMITDRDVCMGAYTQGKSLREIPVASAMSRIIYACRPDDTVQQAEEVLKARQIRRLPVVDGDGRLVGVLSLNDIAVECERERGAKKREVGPAEIAETLAAVCSHSRPESTAVPAETFAV